MLVHACVTVPCRVLRARCCDARGVLMLVHACVTVPCRVMRALCSDARGVLMFVHEAWTIAGFNGPKKQN
jgi:hypothetical protein